MCTLFPEGEWGHCCFEHDLHYWAGGTKARRNWADLELKACVKDSGHPHVARWMYRGVRWGRLSPLKFKSKSWGHAFTGRRRYQAHTEAEIWRVYEDLSKYDFSYELKNKLLDSLEDFN